MTSTTTKKLNPSFQNAAPHIVLLQLFYMWRVALLTLSVFSKLMTAPSRGCTGRDFISIGCATADTYSETEAIQYYTGCITVLYY